MLSNEEELNFIFVGVKQNRDKRNEDKRKVIKKFPSFPIAAIITYSNIFKIICFRARINH